METQDTACEQLRLKIFSNYRLLLEEVTDNHRGKFWDSIRKWVEKHSWLRGDERVKRLNLMEEMGFEIFQIIVGRNDDPEQKGGLEKTDLETVDDLFKYLNKCLKNAVIKLTEKHAYRGITWIPGKFKDVEKLINAKEKERGRSLTDDERKEIINMFVAKEVEKQINAKKKGRGKSLTDDERKKRINKLKAEYLEIKGMLAPISLETDHKTDEKGNASNLLNNPEQKSAFYFTDNSNSYGIGSERICEAVEHVLGKKRWAKDEVRNRALFTVFCIEEYPGDLENLASVLHVEVLNEYFRTKRKPNRPEIYMKYHRSDVTVKSAESKASVVIKEFRNDLTSFLKGEICPPVVMPTIAEQALKNKIEKLL